MNLFIGLRLLITDFQDRIVKISDFNDRLKDFILIADGAMGSMLHDTVGLVRCFDELNATQPEAVFRVHQAYIEAGAQIIETNTFGANRFKLAALGLGDDVQRLNSRGVKIAREARESASREVLIAGSIGPLGIGVQARHPEPDYILSVFHEQALALEERGVDLFVLETFSYIEELLLAIDAIRSFSSLPIVAQLTFSEEGTIYSDVRPFLATSMIKPKNVQAIGSNCTLGPQSLLPILQEIAHTGDVIVSGMPNAGFPKREGDRIVYPKSSPEYFAEFAREAAAIGVRILGGCCGTTPAHIRAMADAVKSLRPTKTPATASVVAAAQPSPPVQAREPESKLWKKLQKKEFVLCVEIDPPKGIPWIASMSKWTKSRLPERSMRSTSTAAPWLASVWMRSSLPALSRRAASKPCLISPRAIRTSSACRPCCSVRGRSGASATFS
jgi:methionine synthase / methylenetetrahydrofolate reductase(NADPH)